MREMAGNFYPKATRGRLARVKATKLIACVCFKPIASTLIMPLLKKKAKKMSGSLNQI